MSSRRWGYARVSDKDQNEARQLEALDKADVDSRYIFIDKQSGKNFDRPQYTALKNALREGDMVVIQSIDRLGRNYNEILNEWRELTKEMMVDIQVIDMPLLDTTLYKDLLGTFIADLILQILAYVAQQEREFNKKRQAEGIAIAKAEGIHMGRPRKAIPDGFDDTYKEWKAGMITARKAMQLLGLKPTTFYNMVRDYEQSK